MEAPHRGARRDDHRSGRGPAGREPRVRGGVAGLDRAQHAADLDCIMRAMDEADAGRRPRLLDQLPAMRVNDDWFLQLQAYSFAYSLLAMLAGLLRDLIPWPQLAVGPSGLTAVAGALPIPRS